MQILISCSKTMQFGQCSPEEKEYVQTVPRFLNEANEMAQQLMQLTPEHMAKLLKVSHSTTD